MLGERSINSQPGEEGTILDLQMMRSNGLIQIISGSLDFGSLIDCKFKVKASGQTWRIYSVNDVHGGLRLEKSV
jgi:hypothetical protein